MASEKDDSLQVLPPKRSPTAAAVSSRRESSAGPTVSLTAEQFQKLCSTHQPNALSMISHSSCLPSSSSSGISPSTWVFDSGATHHMTSDLSLFTSLSSLSTSISVLTVNGTSMSLAGIGSITTSGLCLSDVYYIPQLTLNLISISQLCASGYVVQFSSTSCYVQDPHSKKLIGTGRREGG